MDTASPMPTLGTLVKRFREDRGMTQEQLGALLQRGGSSVAHYENDKRSMSYEVLDRAVRVFNLSADDEAMLRLAKQVASAALSTKPQPPDAASAAALGQMIQELSREIAGWREDVRLLTERLDRLEQQSPPEPVELRRATPKRPRRAPPST